jgi:selenocysteine lyase/cysteine desulfurase
MLTAWLIEELLALRHANGAPLVRIFGPTTMERRGGTVTFNFYDASGRTVDHQSVEAGASTQGISLRTGCFCNPGAGEVALGLSRPQLEACFGSPDDRMTYDDLRRCIDPNAAGAVRVSLGLASNFEDVYTFVEWARAFVGGGGRA